MTGRVLGRDPARLLFVSFASQLRPDATAPQLARAAWIADRYFRSAGFALNFTCDPDYFAAIEDIAKVFRTAPMAEADEALATIDAYLESQEGAPKHSAQDEALNRFTPVIDAAVLFGVSLGIHLASIADSVDAQSPPSSVGGV
jgi:hypothetical protein